MELRRPGNRTRRGSRGSRPPPSRRPSAQKRAGSSVSPEDRAKAEQIASRSGIPLAQAILVAKGRATLNDVLQEMFALERRDRLVREGMNPELAGLVARGRLSLGRARVIQELWSCQGASFKSEAMKTMIDEKLVAFGVFGRGVVGGVVKHVSRYEVTVVSEGASEPVILKKHDIKYYCEAAVAADVLVRIGRHAEVARLGLGSSLDLADRFRPTEEMAVEWVKARQRILFIFRDGETLVGVPRRVALYEIEIEVAPDVRVCLLTHALYKPNPYIRNVSNDG